MKPSSLSVLGAPRNARSDSEMTDDSLSKMIPPPIFTPLIEVDLVVGNTIYVHGRKASIELIDYPLVFWRYEGTPGTFHRSVVDAPHIFQVAVSDRNTQQRNREQDLHSKGDDDDRDSSRDMSNNADQQGKQPERTKSPEMEADEQQGR